jgi:hypothetical protein
MAATHHSAFDVAANVADNLCHWDGASREHYEIWFLTLNQVASKSGFWFRYAIHASQRESGIHEPCAELWASFFDRARPEKNFGLVRRSPIAAFACEKQKFDLRIGDAKLSTSVATGEVESAGHRPSGIYASRRIKQPTITCRVSFRRSYGLLRSFVRRILTYALAA